MTSSESSAIFVPDDVTLLELYNQLNGLFNNAPLVEGDDAHHFLLPLPDGHIVGIDDSANSSVKGKDGQVVYRRTMEERHPYYIELARLGIGNFQLVSQGDSDAHVSLGMYRPGMLADTCGIQLALAQYLDPKVNPNDMVCIDFEARKRMDEIEPNTVLHAIAKSLRARKGEWETQLRF